MFRPALNGKPVVVLSNNDGACIARSNEAKDLGVKMAQPWFEVKHLERSAGLIALSANFELYGDMSSRMMVLAARYAPRQEIYSIDECFLDFAGVPGDLAAIGRELRRQVLQWVGLPTSVGFGPTKTLAKLANHMAKTADRKPGSYPPRLAQVCDFGALEPEDLDDVMRRTDVGDIWGIGRKTAPKLHEAGIRTVLDLRARRRRHPGAAVQRGHAEDGARAAGHACMEVDDDPPAQQQIMCSRSFGDPVTELPDLIEVVSGFATRVAGGCASSEALAMPCTCSSRPAPTEDGPSALAGGHPALAASHGGHARPGECRGHRHCEHLQAGLPLREGGGDAGRAAEQPAGAGRAWISSMSPKRCNPTDDGPDGNARCTERAVRPRCRGHRQCGKEKRAQYACIQAGTALAAIHDAAG